MEKEEESSTIEVAYTIDVSGTGAAQFCDQLLVSVYSLRGSMSDSDRLDVRVFYSNVPPRLMESVVALSTDRFRVSFRHIPDDMMAVCHQCSRRNPSAPVRTFSGITFARDVLPRLMPSSKRVIYIDADTMCRSSLKTLWDVELKDGNLIGAPLGVVPEYGFYSGTILMDLEGMRSGEKSCEEFFKYAAREAYRFYLPDQTSMNRFFYGKIQQIDSDWIFPPTAGKRDPAMESARMWHFYNGPKPYRINRDDAGAALIQWNNVLADAEAEIDGRA